MPDHGRDEEGDFVGELMGHRVGLLCDQLSRWPELAEMIRDGGAHSQLEELLALLAGATNPDEHHVTELVAAIEHACARQGLPAQSRGISSLPPGMGESQRGRPAGWTCPLGRCSRVVLPDETEHPPTCAAARGEDTGMKPYLTDLR